GQAALASPRGPVPSAPRDPPVRRARRRGDLPGLRRSGDPDPGGDRARVQPARPGAGPGPVSPSCPVLHRLGVRAPQDSWLADVAQYHRCMKTIALLAASNVFMTAAWYGHLRFRESALWKVILVSWLLAFFEYCLQVPANRIG